MSIYQGRDLWPGAVGIVRVPDYATGVKLLNDTKIRLTGTAIFHRDGDAARQFLATRTQVGMVRRQRAIPVAYGFHSFGRLKALAVWPRCTCLARMVCVFYTKRKAITLALATGIRSARVQASRP